MHLKQSAAALVLVAGAAVGWLAASGTIVPKALGQRPPAENAAAGSPRHEGPATLPCERGFPAEETARILRDELVFQRAVQGYLWSLPAVNMWAMKEGSEKVFGGGYHILPTWTKRITAKT